MCLGEQGARRRRGAVLSRREIIDRKRRLLEQLDPDYAAKLDLAFTGHLADAVRASSQSERRQALEKALEAYENALDEAL
jgi:hypothetical protein